MAHRNKNSEKKAMQAARETMLTTMTSDEIAGVARELAPEIYADIVQLESAPERADLLVKVACRDRWLDKLSAFVLSRPG